MQHWLIQYLMRTISTARERAKVYLTILYYIYTEEVATKESIPFQGVI